MIIEREMVIEKKYELFVGENFSTLDTLIELCIETEKCEPSVESA